MEAPPPLSLSLYLSFSSCEANLQIDLCVYSMPQWPEHRHILGLKLLPSSPWTGRKPAQSCEAAKALGRASLFWQVGMGYAMPTLTPSADLASSGPPSCAHQECPLGIS